MSVKSNKADLVQQAVQLSKQAAQLSKRMSYKALVVVLGLLIAVGWASVAVAAYTSQLSSTI